MIDHRSPSMRWALDAVGVSSTMLDIETFNNSRGGSVSYKALAHPVAAEALARLSAAINRTGNVAIYDPEGMAAALLALMPAVSVEGIYVHDSLAVGQTRAGHATRPLLQLSGTRASSVLVASFNPRALLARISALLPGGAQLHTLDEVRLPASMLTNPVRYLDPLNFATNFAFFRDDGHLGTRLTTVNYWGRHGAHAVRLFLRLYDQSGAAIAEWEQTAAPDGGGIIIDSGDVRRRHRLAPFTGQLFIHAVGVAGHDVLKYALDTYATDGGASLSGTHDANAWPAERYAGLPAPAEGERVTLWIQNSHARPIPAGAISLCRMGAEAAVAVDEEIGAFATRAIDVARYLPQERWPSQLELLAGRHVVRPRYEVTREARTRIAHVNVERGDLREDPGIRELPPELGRGFLLPFPVLPRDEFRTWVQPTPMAHSEADTPLRIDVFAPDGSRIADHFLGVLPRGHDLALDLDTILPKNTLHEGGHAELVYDFRSGGQANGWLHALFRYEHRRTQHVAESSFGSHIFNTLMTYRDEPQSYSGPPPGLSTRLYLRLPGEGQHESFCVLIYPASARWLPQSSTDLELYAPDGQLIDQRRVAVACGGSARIRPLTLFGREHLQRAGSLGYVLVRDTTCRLFGFQGLRDPAGAFSFDHMFGF